MTDAEATTTENAASVAEQGAHVAPEKASSKKGASQKKGAPKAKKGAKAAKPKKGAKSGNKAARPAQAKDASTPRAESKGAKILELVGRPKGATLTEIVKATDWQKTLDPGLPLDRRQEARAENRVNEDRVWRSRIPDQEVAFQIDAATCKRGGFFLFGAWDPGPPWPDS
jgi:hypothetical protein